MKITIEVEEAKDHAPLITALRNIDRICGNLMISGDVGTDVSNELSKIMDACSIRGDYNT